MAVPSKVFTVILVVRTLVSNGSQKNKMALKRSYQVPSKYVSSKRQRTLTQEVSMLKRKVNANKHELKYYDGIFSSGTSPNLDIDNQSIFTDVPNLAFIGRKLRVMKIEVKILENEGFSYVSMWRESRPGKTVPVDEKWPLAFDPEYHTHLRHWDAQSHTTKQVPEFIVNFGKTGRLVEFDNQTNGIAGGAITTGDIKMNGRQLTSDNLQPLIEFRVWYTDA